MVIRFYRLFSDLYAKNLNISQNYSHIY